MNSFTATHAIAGSWTAATAEDTAAIGAALADRYRQGGLLALDGPLGAGKTTLIRGLVAALGATLPVKSPSFVLQHLYPCSGGMVVEHWDLYRLLSAPPSEVEVLERELGAHGGLVLLEWPGPLAALGWGADADWLTIAVEPAEDEREPVRTLTLWTPQEIP